MKTYEVTYMVDGRGRYSLYVQAKDSSAARRVALSQITGMPGYVGKRITITGCFQR